MSLQRLPFRDFTAEEFLGRTLTTCRGAGGCVSVFQGSSLTLGQMADACVYVGGGAESIRKRSQLDSGDARAVFVRSKLQLMGQALDSEILNPRCLLLKTKLDRSLRARDVTAT